MKKQDFLNSLKSENKLELVEPSEDIMKSCLEKSATSLKASQILLDSNLLEESVSMSYYAMYHCLLALLFKCGIKCENHTDNILLLKRLFNENELHEMISAAKEERIDKQYYVDFEITKDETKGMIEKSREFITKVKLIIESLTHGEIDKIRSKFKLF